MTDGRGSQEREDGEHFALGEGERGWLSPSVSLVLYGTKDHLFLTRTCH